MPEARSCLYPGPWWFSTVSGAVVSALESWDALLLLSPFSRERRQGGSLYLLFPCGNDGNGWEPQTCSGGLILMLPGVLCLFLLSPYEYHNPPLIIKRQMLLRDVINFMFHISGRGERGSFNKSCSGIGSFSNRSWISSSHITHNCIPYGFILNTIKITKTVRM